MQIAVFCSAGGRGHHLQCWLFWVASCGAEACRMRAVLVPAKLTTLQSLLACTTAADGAQLFADLSMMPCNVLQVDLGIVCSAGSAGQPAVEQEPVEGLLCRQPGWRAPHRRPDTALREEGKEDDLAAAQVLLGWGRVDV